MTVMILHRATHYRERNAESTNPYSLTQCSEGTIVAVCSVESFLSR